MLHEVTPSPTAAATTAGAAQPEGAARPADSEPAAGTRLVDLTDIERVTAPLTGPRLRTVVAAASAAEDLFGMTFVAPLAAAIVERRGGMLVHGAIIAREYGLPCVTGVPDATLEIHTGDLLTVDGFLGIVVVGGTPPGTVLPADT